jgi:hypothetical protein
VPPCTVDIASAASVVAIALDDAPPLALAHDPLDELRRQLA